MFNLTRFLDSLPSVDMGQTGAMGKLSPPAVVPELVPPAGHSPASQSLDRNNHVQNTRTIKRETRQMKWENAKGRFEATVCREVITETNVRKVSVTVNQTFEQKL